MLQFASTQELIDELFNRRGFAGVIVYSTEQHLHPNQVVSGNDLLLRTSADEQSTLRVLEHAIVAFQEQVDHNPQADPVKEDE